MTSLSMMEIIKGTRNKEERTKDTRIRTIRSNITKVMEGSHNIQIIHRPSMQTVHIQKEEIFTGNTTTIRDLSALVRGLNTIEIPNSMQTKILEAIKGRNGNRTKISTMRLLRALAQTDLLQF